MSVTQHHVVVATTSNEGWVKDLKDWISKQPPDLRTLCTSPFPSLVNGYWTVIMIPDGSNEGWPQSEAGNYLRSRFIDQLKGWDWIEIGYGELGPQIGRTNVTDSRRPS